MLDTTLTTSDTKMHVTRSLFLNSSSSWRKQTHKITVTIQSDKCYGGGKNRECCGCIE